MQTASVLMGEAVMVAPSVAVFGARPLFAVSDNGTLAYRGGSEYQFSWLDRKGGALDPVAEATAASFARISPDGTRIVFDRVDDAGGVDIWVKDIARDVTTRLTFDPARDEFPIWSPDGRRILFRSNRGGTFDLYEKTAEGTGDERLVLHTDLEKWPDDWSPDGRYVIYEERSSENGDDLWLLPMDGDRKPIALVRSPFTETFGQFSPDGRWIAYQSDQSGRSEVSVRPFGPLGTDAASGGVYQVSRDGGERPLWRRDGRELIYIGANRAITAVDVPADPRIRTGTPRPLVQMPPSVLGFTRLELHPDGQRFLVRAPAGDDATAPINIVMNWQAALRQ